MERPVEVKVRKKLEESLGFLESELGAEESFDVVVRPLSVAGRDGALVFVDGFINDEVMVRVTQSLFRARREDLMPGGMGKLLKSSVPYVEVMAVGHLDMMVNEILAGQTALLVDGVDEGILIDARTYPARNPDEPDLERVLRGSRDGFTETVVFNIALVRRRLRDPKLRVELLKVGLRSKTDVAVLYIKDLTNPSLLETVKRRITDIEVDGIPMAEKTVEEFLVGRRNLWNPFPVVRYTERPDVAAIHLLEGHVVVMVDTSPSAIILPATLFHHVQHAEEYREDVVVGAYLRLARLTGIVFSFVGPPLWLALILQRDILPEGLRFLGPRDPGNVPILAQFLIADMGVDVLRMALIHTPSALGTALGFIGAILLGQIAVDVGLFAAETVLYIAIAALGTFATPSMEFGLAVRLMRLVLLVFVAILGLPGFLLGLVLIFIGLASTRSFGVPYLWPLIPLDVGALSAVLFRRSAPATGARLSILKPKDPDRKPSPEPVGGESRS